MTTTTPEMNLTLPDVATPTSLGTLPQDWALIINSNIVKIDDHDHAESGAQISSDDIAASQDVDLNSNSVSNIKYVGFVTSSVPTSPLSLFSDGTDLFFQDGNNVTVQITKLGAINSVASIGGFFGDYVASGAVAFMDGVQNTYGFNGPGPLNLDNSRIDAAAVTFTNTGAGLNLINLSMPVNFISSATNTTMTLTTVTDFPKRSIVTDVGGGYEFSNVVGDGSTYSTTRHNVPITSPNGIYGFNGFDIHQTNQIIQPNVVAHQAINGSNYPNSPGNSNQMEMFANVAFLSFTAAERTYTARETKNFTVRHMFPVMATIPHWDGTYSLNMAKWAFNGTGLFQALEGFYITITTVTYVNDGVNPPYFDVAGTILNTADVGGGLSANVRLYSQLRICAIFPLYNAQGVFFGAQY